jgi:hypothetical protein
MPQGLQIMDADGNVIFDTNVRAGRVLGTATVAASTAGSVSNAGLTTGTPFWIYQATTTAYFARAPTISVAGSTLSWAADSDRAGLIVYGVY